MTDKTSSPKTPTYISFNRYESAFLKLLKHLNKSNSSKSLQRIDTILEVLASMQLVTVLFLFDLDIENYSNFEGLITMMSIIRPDFICVRYSVHMYFIGISYTILFLVILGFIVLYFEILFKSFPVFDILVLCLRVLLSIFVRIFKFPFLVLLCLMLSSSSESFYNKSPEDLVGLENYAHAPGLIAVIILSFVNQMRSLSRKLITKQFARRNLLIVDRKEETSLILTLFCCVSLQRTNFTYVMVGAIGIFMFKEFYFYMPSHSYTENLIKMSKYLLVISTCCAYFVALIIKEPGLMFLNLVTIFPLLVLITIYRLHDRLASLQFKKIKKVTEIDLIVRFHEKFQNFDTFVQEMYHEFGNDFELCIIESKYYSEVFKDYELSMLKLSKIYYFQNFAQNKNLLTQLELKFKFYCQFEHLTSNLKLKTESAVKTGLKMRKIKENDLKTSFMILKFLESLSINKKRPGIEFLANCEELINSLDTLESNYRALIKEFPTEKEFENLFRTLMQATNRTCGKTELRLFKSTSNVSNQAIRNSEIPLIVVNAKAHSMGEIVFMNYNAKRALQYESQCKHLTKLLPFITKDELKKYLKHLILDSNQLTHLFPYTCLEKHRGGNILVKMTINVTWHKLNPYIVLTFTKHKKDKIGILYNENGEILSEQTYFYEPNFLNEKIHEIEALQDYTITLLDLKDSSLGLIKFALPIYLGKVKILILFQNNKTLEEINREFNSIDLNNEQDDSEILSRKMTYENSEFPRFRISQDSKEELEDRTNGLDDSNQEFILRIENMKSLKKSISTFIRPIKIGLAVALAIFTLSSISLILITHFGIREIVSNIAIDELGKMRALTQQVSTTTRSLYLLSKGYEMEYSEEHYRSLLETASRILKDTVLRFQDGVTIDLFLEKDLFTSNTVHVYDKLEDKVHQTTLPLSEGLKKLTDYSVYLNANSIYNMTHHYYILRNGPNDLLTVLNDTVYQALQHTISRIYTLEQIYDLLCILIFVPSVLLLISVTPSIKYLEQSNQLLSACFKKIKNTSVTGLGSQMQERLVMNFNLEEVFEFGSKLNKIKFSMWTIWRYTFLLLIAASGGSYIAVTFVYPSQIFSIINQQPLHDFWYGYARMIPLRTYFWTRETYLNFESENSYNQMFYDNSPISDFKRKTFEVSDEYKFSFQNLRYRLKDTYTNTLDDAMQVFYGKACKVVGSAISNCEKTIVANGLASGILDYISFVNAVADMSERGEIDYQTVKKLERNCNTLNAVAGKLMGVVTSSSEDILFNLIEKQIVLSIFVFILLGAFIYIVVKKGPLKIGDRLIAKYVLISIIDFRVLRGFIQRLNKVSLSMTN